MSGETCRRVGVSACRRFGHAWRGRVALPRDRRCTSGNVPFLITLRNSLSQISPLFTFSRHATPVARERNPTAPRVPKRPNADTPTRRYVSPDAPIRRYVLSRASRFAYIRRCEVSYLGSHSRSVCHSIRAPFYQGAARRSGGTRLQIRTNDSGAQSKRRMLSMSAKRMMTRPTMSTNWN